MCFVSPNIIYVNVGNAVLNRKFLCHKRKVEPSSVRKDESYLCGASTKALSEVCVSEWF